MTDNLHLLEPDRQLFWIDWTTLPNEQWYRLLPGTVMMVKDDRFRYPEIGPGAQLGEDLAFAASLYREVPVAMMSGMGWLYLYIFHGGNTCSKNHHYRLAACRSFPNEWVEAHSEEIRQAMRHYPIPRPVVVCGTRGPVFRLP